MTTYGVIMPHWGKKETYYINDLYDILTHTESFELYAEGLVQDCSKSIANALDTVALH